MPLAHLTSNLVYEAPARGAQLGQVIPASVVAVVVIAVVAWLSVRHRRGTFRALERAGALAERVSGLPGWAVLPGLLSRARLFCGAVALSGFPLDDVWHTLFGQDVTLWGPTHIQMIGGASLATLAMWALFEEGRRERQERPQGRVVRWLIEHEDVLLGGAALMG